MPGQEIRRGERVVSPKELRENAEECMDWARTARSDRERAIFLQMAETWRQAADRLERVQPGSYSLEHLK